MSKARLLASWTIGLAAVLQAAPCQAQGNIDRGKTPAQAFAETCAACHRSPHALKRTSAAFLRLHYAASSAQASAMAAYLAGFPSEPARHRGEAAKQHAQPQPIAQTAGQDGTVPSQPSGERLADGNEGRLAPPVANPSLAPAPPALRPVLEPFEE